MTCGTLLNGLMDMWLESKKERTERTGPNKINSPKNPPNWIMTKWSPNLVTTTKTGNFKIQDAQWKPSRINTKATSSHFIVKLLKAKDKEKNPEATRQEKKKRYTMYNGKVILITANFFFEHPEKERKSKRAQTCALERYGWRPIGWKTLKSHISHINHLQCRDSFGFWFKETVKTLYRIGGNNANSTKISHDIEELSGAVMALWLWFYKGSSSFQTCTDIFTDETVYLEFAFN